MAAPFYTPAMALEDADDAVKKAKRDLANLERETRLYDAEIDYSPSLRRALFNAREKLAKAERKLARLTKRKSNPRAPTVTRKKRRTPAQIRATKKLVALNRKRHGKKTRRRNPARGNFLTARSTLRTGRNPVRPLRKVNDYGIKGSGKWFDGVGWTATKANAAKWGNLKACQTCAQKVSDRTNKSVSIHSL